MAGSESRGNKTVVLPAIPTKRYFTIGEVGDLCCVKPHVLRYWEQEFSQLKLVKRRGNRRYYQYHEVLLVRHIRGLLYEQGFTISGARNRLEELHVGKASSGSKTEAKLAETTKVGVVTKEITPAEIPVTTAEIVPGKLLDELQAIAALLHA